MFLPLDTDEIIMFSVQNHPYSHTILYWLIIIIFAPCLREGFKKINPETSDFVRTGGEGVSPNPNLCFDFLAL